jgi:2-keto-4-pentenoate hydratase/2-oxohepta-3-ene-1,7-dioic acid hydratase in catechol pathway
MKLVRFGDPARERPGLLDADGTLLDLSKVLPDIDAAAIQPESLRELARAAAGRSLPRVSGPVRLGPCVTGVGKIVCVGLNYHGHIREVGAAVPAEPVLFMKAPSSISGPFDDVFIPPGAAAVDWEVELGVVIGTRATRVTREKALEHVAGYCIVNDLSERDWQLKGTGQWVKGKSADTFAPLGPWLVTADEIADPQGLTLELRLNGELQQRGETADMVFGVAEIVSYTSRFMTLLPGDVISTGTPLGVGMGQNPPRYLRAGDVMELSVSALGSQRQRVSDAPV